MCKFSGVHRISFFSVWLAVSVVVLILWISRNNSAQANPNAFTAVQTTLRPLTDAWIFEGNPGSACGGEDYLATGYDSFNNIPGNVHSFLKFDLTKVPPGSVVTQATLKLFYIGIAGPSTGIFPIRITRVDGPWAENSVMWNNAPAISTGDTITASVDHNMQNTWTSFDVTELVQGWVSGENPNYGFALLGPEDSLEFFESSDSFDPEFPQTQLHPPGLDVTYLQPMSSPSFADQSLLPAAFFPLVMKNYPPTLELHPIDNDGGEGNYTITWSLYPKGAFLYELYEWNGSGWITVFSTSTGETSFTVTDKPLGTYSYYLKATGSWGSEISLVRSVTVSDRPNQFVYLVIGVGDYQNMNDLHTPDAKLGFDLRYPIYDATDVQDMLQVYGDFQTQPLEHVLSLMDSQATKAAIQTAITDWIDLRENKDTTIFIYFAGHTLLADEPLQPYLASYDLACDPCGLAVNWLPASAISAEEINTWLGDLASNKVIFVFDSHQSERWIPALSAENRIILAGSKISEYRWEFQDIKNGAFSWYFNQAYTQGADQNSDGSVSIAEVFAFCETLHNFVYNHTLTNVNGPFQQNAVVEQDPGNPGKFVKPVAIDTCAPLP